MDNTTQIARQFCRFILLSNDKEYMNPFYGTPYYDFVNVLIKNIKL